MASQQPIDRKARVRLAPQPMPELDPQERVHNFEELYLTPSLETARLEAARCIQCPAIPCVKACPLHNDIPGALALLESGDVIGAALRFRETSNAPEICGRLCPQEQLCEGACVIGKKALPVAIGRLEAFVADYQRRADGLPRAPLAPTGCRVAVVGSGPAGLTVAEELALRGHAVTVYEAWPRPGGLLRYGIPSFKLNKAVLEGKLEQLRRLGVEFVTNTTVGQDITVDDLLAQGFDAAFLGQGAGLGKRLEIPGEELAGVYAATEFLVRGNLPLEELPLSLRSRPQIGERVAVIGGGDTAMDCVRTARRLGAQEVTCLYRRTEAEMPGRRDERRHAREEGIGVEFLVAPLAFLGDSQGHLRAVECQRMALGEPDPSGRRRPVPVPGSQFTLAVDCAIIAIGYDADPLIPSTTHQLQGDGQGLLVTDAATGQTTRPGVFSGGDAVRGPDFVVNAIADGRRAAEAIHQHLMSRAAIPAKVRPSR